MCIRDIKINGVRDPVGFQMQEVILSYEADGAPDGDLVAAIALDADCEQIVYKQKLDIRTNYATKLDFVPEPETRYFVFILCGTQKSQPCILESGTRFDCPFITSAEPIEHPVFSKRFSLPGNVTRARLYVTGLGLYEAFVNGEKAGNEYILANVIAKRAKTLEKEMPDFIEASQEKAISLAARELYSGKIEAELPENEKKNSDESESDK